MAEVENRVATVSPPPNCAICLGSCTDKCFSDSCMHQFCFTCLLEWSKVKPVCPLCKQPFKSIIHNVKSNDEYDQHVVERPDNNNTNGNMFEEHDLLDMLDLPNSTLSRQFQFRTTFTVDPRGELAIQQMLLTHPLTNSVYIPGYNPMSRFNNNRYHHRRRDMSSTGFRRHLYNMDYWAVSPPQHEMLGRFRETSPEFFSENPGARNRLVPWLNRELNALLEENTQQVMQLVDVILTHLLQHDINSQVFRNLLQEYLNVKTDHFIHEFYSFMRSPYDMIGYDRSVLYAPRPIELISDRDSDSDVAIVSVMDSHTLTRPTLEVIEIPSSDGDDVILVDSESQETQQEPVVAPSTAQSSGDERRKPILPLKIRIKHQQRQSRDKRNRKRKHQRSSSSSSLTSSSSSLSSSSSSSRSKSKRKSKMTKRILLKKSRKSYDSSENALSSTDEDNIVFKNIFKKRSNYDSDDNVPIAKLKSRMKKKKSLRKRSSPSETVTSASLPLNDQIPPCQDDVNVNTDSYIPTTSYYGNLNGNDSNNSVDYAVTPEYGNGDVKISVNVAPTPGPSSGRLKSVIVKRENSNNLWYARPCFKEETSDDD